MPVLIVFDEASASEWGRMMAEMKDALPPWGDSLVGAIARAYSLTVATRNERHFRGCQTVHPYAK